MTDAARIRELMLINLFAVFNERDAERKLEAIARNYTGDVIWSDPDRTTRGHEALNDRAQKLLDGLPGFVFTAAGPIHVSRDLGHLAFNLGPSEQPPAVSGIDVALVRDGRIAVLHAVDRRGLTTVAAGASQIARFSTYSSRPSRHPARQARRSSPSS
jgi:SnoaL-like domain